MPRRKQQASTWAIFPALLGAEALGATGIYCPKAAFQKSTGVQGRGDKQAEVVPRSLSQPCVACSALAGLCCGSQQPAMQRDHRESGRVWLQLTE